MKVSRITPYGSGRTKDKEVEAMFDNIAPAYDFMNTAMSFGLHRHWRDTALKMLLSKLKNVASPEILDVATGTGDVAFAINHRLPQAEITGIDLSAGMLDIARKKKSESCPDANIDFMQGDSLNLPFDDNSFNAVTVAYGVRNFADLHKGLSEMCRVIKPGGLLCIIELSEPATPFMRFFYRLYTSHIIPTLGKIISGDNSAYTYLPKSVAACPQRRDMTTLMGQAGFTCTLYRSLTFGAVTIYIGQKPELS